MKRMIISQEMSMAHPTESPDGMRKGMTTEQLWKVVIEENGQANAPLTLEEMMGLINITFRTSMSMAEKLPPSLKHQVHVQVLKEISSEIGKWGGVEVNDR